MYFEGDLIPYDSAILTGKRVLVFAPHPDDETIGCGGSLALHALAGDPVRVVFLTNGCRGDTSGLIEKEAYVALRQREARMACAHLGVTDLAFWAYEDRALAGSRGALKRVLDVLVEFEPDLVYVPSPLEYHPDHRAACFLLCDAIRGVERDFEIAFYELGQPVRPNVIIDITGVLGKKRAALQAYKSQLEEKPYDDISLGLNRYRSMTLTGSTHAEGYSLWKAGLVREVGPFSIPFQQAERLLPGADESGPLVSVIVRTKDRPALLANSLISVAKQTYANLEIVVVNDGGEDVKDVALSLARGIPVNYIVHQKTQGRAAAANSGVKATSGLYLNFLDDDDVFYPDHVRTLVKAAQSNSEKVVYSGVTNAYYEGPPHDPGNCIRKEDIFNQPFDPDLFLFSSHIPIMSVLFHRDVFQAVDEFSPDLELFEDWDFLIRASRQFNFRHVDKVTAEYRFYGVKDTEASHRGKYAYDQAQAAIFDRAAPYITGKGWIKFLESELPYALGRNKSALDRLMNPLKADLLEKAKALEAMQAENSKLADELARTSAVIEQSGAKTNALQARNERLEALLSEVVGSRGWMWLTRFRKLKMWFGARKNR